MRRNVRRLNREVGHVLSSNIASGPVSVSTSGMIPALSTFNSQMLMKQTDYGDAMGHAMDGGEEEDINRKNGNNILAAASALPSYKLSNVAAMNPNLNTLPSITSANPNVNVNVTTKKTKPRKAANLAGENVLAHFLCPSIRQRVLDDLNILVLHAAALMMIPIIACGSCSLLPFIKF